MSPLIWPQALRIAARDSGGDDTFRRLGATAGFDGDASRSLVIVVHPGDAIERYLGPDVAAWSQANQAAMAAELEQALDAGHGAVVIHRASSAELRANAVLAWRDAVRRATDSGVVLYGDGVCDAGAWIAEHLVQETTEQVHLLGAYADAEHGCITAVGQAISDRWPNLLVTVSPAAPADSSDCGTPSWEGSGGRQSQGRQEQDRQR